MYQCGTSAGFCELVQMLRFPTATVLTMMIAPACAAPERAAEAPVDEVRTAAKSEINVANEALPPNQRFASLDRYLLYLQNEVGPTDGAWYRMISPGVYQLETGNARRLADDGQGAPEKRIFTREEVMRK